MAGMRPPQARRNHRPATTPQPTRKPAGPQAVAGAVAWRNRLVAYLLRHLQTALASLGRASRTPFSSLITAGAIGIALALPAGLYVVLQEAQRLSGSLDDAAQISLFLKASVADAEAREVAARLRKWPEIGAVHAISKSEALEEFRRASGFGQALDALPENPLPAVLVLQPKAEHAQPQQAQGLLDRLRALPEVDIAQLDLEWLQRLSAIMELAQRGVLVAAGLLGLAVLLVIGNTIRLDIQSRRDEIVIMKLIGATNAFIRRPFLYAGFWYGLGGGLIAWFLVSLSLWLLREPVARLSSLYAGGFQVPSLDFHSTLALLALSAVLGVSGSLLAVSRHLGAIEPA